MWYFFSNYWVEDLDPLEELNLEDNMFGRKNAIKKYVASHIPKYLVDIVLGFLGTREYSLITKPKYTFQNTEHLKWPFGVAFDKQKLMAVGYYTGNVAIWDIRSQKLIRYKGFTGRAMYVLSFRGLWLVGFVQPEKILLLDFKLEEKATISLKDVSNIGGMAVCERRSWIAVSERYSCRVQIFELDTVDKNIIELTAVITIAGLNHPTRLCFNREGSILAVLDLGSNTIFVFNPLEREKQFSFGSNQLTNPADVKLDIDGNFLVCDTGSRRLSIFDPAGTFLLSVLVGFSSTRAGFLGVDSSGTVAVSLSDSHEVFIF